MAGLSRRREPQESGDSCFLTTLKCKLADKIVFSKIRARCGGRLSAAITGSAAMNAEINPFFKDFDATREVMTTGGGFRTGERGRLDKDGCLFITGRIKEQ